MRKPRNRIPVHPLAGQPALNAGDVRMMLRGDFWPVAAGPKDFPGPAMAAALALQALAGIPPSRLHEIELATALGERDPTAILIPLNGRTRRIKLTAAAARAVHAWKKVRPTTGSTKLFVTFDGVPITSFVVYNCMARAGEALGLGASLVTCARAFFIESFRSNASYDGDAERILKRYLAGFIGPRAPASSDRSDTKFVLGRADPFPSAGLRPTPDAEAIAAARKLGTTLPVTYRECFVDAPKVRQTLPLDHQLLADLAATEWSSNLFIRGKQRAELYLRHRADLQSRLADGTLLLQDAAALFGVSAGQYGKIVRSVEARLKGSRGSVVPKARPPLTDDEKARLDRLGQTTWPPRPQWKTFRWKLLRKNGGFLFALVDAGKLERGAAAELLKVGQSRFSGMKADFENDTFEHWLCPRRPDSEIRTWQAFIHDKRHERRNDQSQIDFIRELRRRYNFSISDDSARAALSGLPGGKRRGHSGKIRVPLDPAEEARLAQIIPPSATGKARQEYRLALLREHGCFVFELVRKERLRLVDAQRIFAVATAMAVDLAALYRDGDFSLCLEEFTPEQLKERRALLLREYERCGADAGLAALCRDIRRRHRVFIPLKTAQETISSLHKRLGRPRIVGARPRGAKVNPTPEERRRLKSIAAIDWSQAEDKAALRRQMLGTEGDFLMRMIDDRKLLAKDGARLLELSHNEIAEVRNDFRAGLARRHTEGAPSGEERDRQIAVVRAEVTPNERNETFIIRLGREHGVLLPRKMIRRLRADLVAQIQSA